jgi:post-segregation antitoxin (ccd killing protein)
VYYVRIARVNVYLPEELAAAARAAGINVSNVTQEALRRELAARGTDGWLARVAGLPPTGVTHRDALGAVRAARDEFGESA